MSTHEENPQRKIRKSLELGVSSYKIAVSTSRWQQWATQLQLAKPWAQPSSRWQQRRGNREPYACNWHRPGERCAGSSNGRERHWRRHSVSHAHWCDSRPGIRVEKRKVTVLYTKKLLIFSILRQNESAIGYPIIFSWISWSSQRWTRWKLVWKKFLQSPIPNCSSSTVRNFFFLRQLVLRFIQFLTRSFQLCVRINF